jgi:hypothetical protein
MKTNFSKKILLNSQENSNGNGFGLVNTNENEKILKKTENSNKNKTPKRINSNSIIDYQEETNFKTEFRKLPGNNNFESFNSDNKNNKNFNINQLTINLPLDKKTKKQYNINSSCNYLQCKNYPKIQELKKFIVELSEEINSLKSVNKSLCQQLEQKEEYMSNILKMNFTTFSNNKKVLVSKSLNKFNLTNCNTNQSINFKSNSNLKTNSIFPSKNFYGLNGRLIDTSNFQYNSQENIDFLNNMTNNHNETKNHLNNHGSFSNTLYTDENNKNINNFDNTNSNSYNINENDNKNFGNNIKFFGKKQSYESISDKKIPKISLKHLPKISNNDNKINKNNTISIEKEIDKDKEKINEYKDKEKDNIKEKIEEMNEDSEFNCTINSKNEKRISVIKKDFHKTGFIYSLVQKVLDSKNLSFKKDSNKNDSFGLKRRLSTANYSPVRNSNRKNTSKSQNNGKIFCPDTMRFSGFNKINTNNSPGKIESLFNTQNNIEVISNNNNNINKVVDKLPTPRKNFAYQMNLPQDLSSKYILNQSSHYNKILNIFKRIEKSSKTTNSKISYLGLSDNILHRMLKSDLIIELGKLTQNDQEFIVSIRYFTDDKLLMISDLISTLISDYQYSLQLIRRIKTFMDISVKLVHSNNANDSIKKIISNCNEVLSSEFTKIYMYQKTDNMLVNLFESISSNIDYSDSYAINDGILGNVYTNNQRQKIDDTSTDNRFTSINSNTKKTKDNKKIKTILCCPLRDEEGNPIGVVQSVNKKSGYFTNDDEELMEIFAKQISSILTNNADIDEFSSHIFHLQNLLEFSLVIPSKDNLLSFIKLCENSIKNIWNIHHARLYFVNNDKKKSINSIAEKDVIDEKIIYFIDGHIFKNKAIGIIGKCLKKREVIPVVNIHDSMDYNSLIDIEGSLCLVTFPILEINSEVDILMIIQIEYNSNYLHLGKLKKNDLDIIKSFSKQVAFWYSKNKIDIDEYIEMIAKEQEEIKGREVFKEFENL